MLRYNINVFVKWYPVFVYIQLFVTISIAMKIDVMEIRWWLVIGYMLLGYIFIFAFTIIPAVVSAMFYTALNRRFPYSRPQRWKAYMTGMFGLIFALILLVFVPYVSRGFDDSAISSNYWTVALLTTPGFTASFGCCYFANRGLQ
nr:hypothetical protein [uncultured bacterium]